MTAGVEAVLLRLELRLPWLLDFRQKLTLFSAVREHVNKQQGIELNQ